MSVQPSSRFTPRCPVCGERDTCATCRKVEPKPHSFLSATLADIAGAQAKPKPIELDWRGKSVRALTPDETVEFAEWAHREFARLRLERDAYLDRAIDAERRLARPRGV